MNKDSLNVVPYIWHGHLTCQSPKYIFYFLFLLNNLIFFQKNE